jgi:hypothetical protein
MTASQGQGLCSGCRNAPTCVFPRDPGKPLLQCEEFEGFPSAPPPPASIEITPACGARAGPRTKRKYKGLCRDCENRRTCTFPKSEGGVWHCEEYR